MTTGRRRDWFRILRDLMAAGVSMKSVARRCNRDPGTVKLWAEGGEPKESDARLVLALYAKHCPAQYTQHAREFAIPEPETGETRVVLLLRRLLEFNLHR